MARGFYNKDNQCDICINIERDLHGFYIWTYPFNRGQVIVDNTYSGNAVILGEDELELIKEITSDKIILSKSSVKIDAITELK